MITVEEKNRGTSGSSTSWTIDHLLTATDGDADLTEWAAQERVGTEVPQSIDDGQGGNLILNDLKVNDFIVTPSRTYAFVSAVYGPPEQGSRLGGGDTTPQAEAGYEFSYQAESTHLFYALATQTYVNESLLPFGAPDFENRIRVNSDDWTTEGIAAPAGNATNTYRLTVPKGFVTSTYEALVEGMMGKVNSEPFKGRPAGTVRFVYCSSDIDARGPVHIRWGMQYKRSRTGITIAGIEGINIGGHDIWWTFDRRTIDDVRKCAVVQTTAVVVQQIFETADLNELGF